MENHTTTIEAGKSNRQYWNDLWDYRELFYFLAWRDVLVRYKQTVIGIAWSVIRPVLTMVVFTVIFGNLAKFPSDGAPYPVMVFVAMLPWQFFATALIACGDSVVGKSSMVSKIYFPRLIIPVTAVSVSLVDFVVSFFILVALMAWFQFVPGLAIIALPLFTIMIFALSLGIGLLFASLNVKYRDFKFIVPFMVQLGLYISPVGFSSSVIPEKWRFIYSLNPVVGIIDGFRWAILGNPMYWPGFYVSLVVTIVSLTAGIMYFRKTEDDFADVI
ncbi:O-antigen export system, permease protein [hydrothermal vent metagenome]|uniref:O-antigen export system, permease protein n=1 Tax=hydrothermal vent metagenome TaxID=652676 RepID=A0A3B1BZJ0_9ZZZZ